MNPYILLALFSGVALAAGLFAVCYFFFVNNLQLQHRLLGIVILAVILRIGKSVFYYLIPDMSMFGISIGFAGLSMIGPTTWFYVLVSEGKRERLLWHDLVHLIIPAVGFGGIASGGTLVSPTVGYVTGTVTLFLYLAAAWFQSENGDVMLRSWNRALLTGLSIVWAAFAFQLVSGSMLNYALGAAVAAGMIYFVLFKVLKNPNLLLRRSPVKLDPSIVERVVDSLEEERMYQVPTLNLSRFSQHIGAPSYLVSRAIKHHYGRNFPEVVNALRVEEVKRRLKLEAENFVKVEGLAYDVGFNTPSAFYAAFKKETDCSPREYQRTLAVVAHD